MASLVYTNAQSQTVSNRITTAGYEDDPAGTQTRGQTENGTWQRYKYDSAGRLAVALDDSSNPQETYSYGASNERLMTVYGNGLGAPATYYCWEGGQVIADFRAGTSNNLVWEKSYVYLGGRLLATTDLYGTKYHHPDRLGTRLVTDGANGTVTTEQVNLPYGTALTSESSGGFNNRRFTSYDRSATTGMDYAVNRFYNPEQGRFNQVDPIGMGAVRLGNPQSLNLYGYCENDPINHVDPDGLFLGKLFGWIGNAIKKVAKVFAVVLAVAAVLAFSWGFAAIGIQALIGAGIFATIGWGSGRVAQFAGAFLGTLGKAGNFRTPSTFPKGTGVSGVSSFIQDKEIKAGPKEDTRWYQLLFEWALGIGPDHRQFGPDSKMTRNISTSPDVSEHRRLYCKGGQQPYKASFRFGLIGWGKGADWPLMHTNAADGALRAGFNMGRQYVGSFTISITRTSDGGALFSAYNETSISSLLAGIPLSVKRGGSILNLPGSTTSQTFWWKEASPCEYSIRAR